MESPVQVRRGHPLSGKTPDEVSVGLSTPSSTRDTLFPKENET